MLDLRGLVRPGDRVLWGQGPAEPTALTGALLAQQDDIGPLTGIVGTMLAEIAPGSLRSLALEGFIGTGPAGRLLEARRLDILPCAISDIPRLIRRRVIGVDVVLVLVSPADAHGRHSLGLAADYVREAMEAARTVVAEVNARVPFTLGESIVSGARFDAVVESDVAPLEVPARAADDVRRRIGERAAALIPDGAVIQIGLGATPDAVLEALHGHRDLGVHSGMITDRVAELMAAGAITNRRKSRDRGVTVTGTLFGTAQGLYRYAHRNPAIALRPASYTHDFAVLRSLERFVAINSALEVDLTGQINAETAAGRYLGAVGGQLDFARGAIAAPGGRSIVALPSTDGHGASRIVVRLDGGTVTTPRSCAGTVVTEFGAAPLHGRPLRERARALAAIAHPDHREGLERAAAVL